MATIQEALTSAWQFFQAGDLPRAERMYRELLQSEPSLVQGWHLLGVVNQAQGKPDEAAANYQKALSLKPDYAEAHYNLGMVFLKRAKLAGAAACFRRALEFLPNFAEALNNLGNVLQAQGQHSEALTYYRKAVDLRPDISFIHNNLGNALKAQGQLDESLACYDRALDLKRDNATAWSNKGHTLELIGQVDQAMACYREAIRLKPDFAEAHNNLGNALQAQGRLEDAVGCYREALRLERNHADAHNNLGSALHAQGDRAAALDCFDEALRISPEHAQAHLSRAFVRLQMGAYEEGWPEFEWRCKCPDYAPPCFAKPPWDGSPLQGRVILLYADQGLGDALQFVRYAPMVRRLGGRVMVACHRPLIRLLETCRGIESWVAKDDPLPEFDVYALLTSLPGILRTTLATVPSDVPYLDAEPVRLESWRRELDAIGGFKIGIAWQGNPRHRRDGLRSFPLARFEPLSRLPGVRLFSLQKGAGAEQLTHWSNIFPIKDLGPRLEDFLDTAAVVRNLDLVITPDTSLAHLVGALGVPGWVALPLAADWRWLEDREDSPWYPTLRLFRQAKLGDWHEVFDRIANRLARLLQEKEIG